MRILALPAIALAGGVAVAAATATVAAPVPVAAQTTTAVLDRAATELRRDPVYVDPQATSQINADGIRRSIQSSGKPIFIAVLPASATDEAGGNPGQVPEALARRTGRAGTYGTLAGNSFRAGSNTLPAGRAPALASEAFDAHRPAVEAVLADFVNRVAAESPSARSEGGPFPSEGGSSDAGGSDGGGGTSLLPVLLLAGAGGGGYYLWRRNRRQQEEARVAEQRDRSLLQAELSVLADDVMALEPMVTIHPEARADYDAGVSRYRVAQAALEHTDDPIDLVRVERVVEEGRYAMSRARAIVQGREPPLPPPDLRERGRRGEPALDVDEDGQPAYVGYGGPFYGGGGWFGGGGGLLTGLFLGSMLGGGPFGWGGGYHETNVHVDENGEGSEGGADGGDWRGGGGDFDFGGGDFGGGDFGGGDFGGGGDF